MFAEKRSSISVTLGIVDLYLGGGRLQVYLQ